MSRVRKLIGKYRMERLLSHNLLDSGFAKVSDRIRVDEVEDIHISRSFSRNNMQSARISTAWNESGHLILFHPAEVGKRASY